MSRQYWEELLWAATSDGTAIANTTTETIIFSNVTIPANFMQDGRALRLRAFGKLSVVTATTPTIQFGLRWGGVAGTLLWQSEALTNGSGVTNVNWSVEIYVQTRSNGSAGTLLVMGDVSVNTGTTSITGQTVSVSGFDAPAAVTVDLTADTALSITAKWGTANASNTLTGIMYHGEALN